MQYSGRGRGRGIGRGRGRGETAGDFGIGRQPNSEAGRGHWTAEQHATLGDGSIPYDSEPSLMNNLRNLARSPRFLSIGEDDFESRNNPSGLSDLEFHFEDFSSGLDPFNNLDFELTPQNQESTTQTEQSHSGVTSSSDRDSNSNTTDSTAVHRSKETRSDRRNAINSIHDNISEDSTATQKRKRTESPERTTESNRSHPSLLETSFQIEAFADSVTPIEIESNINTIKTSDQPTALQSIGQSDAQDRKSLEKAIKDKLGPLINNNTFKEAKINIRPKHTIAQKFLEEPECKNAWGHIKYKNIVTASLKSIEIIEDYIGSRRTTNEMALNNAVGDIKTWALEITRSRYIQTIVETIKGDSDLSKCQPSKTDPPRSQDKTNVYTDITGEQVHIDHTKIAKSYYDRDPDAQARINRLRQIRMDIDARGATSLNKVIDKDRSKVIYNCNKIARALNSVLGDKVLKLYDAPSRIPYRLDGTEPPSDLNEALEMAIDLLNNSKVRNNTKFEETFKNYATEIIQMMQGRWTGPITSTS